MSREYPERPIVGVGGVAIYRGRVLLVKRGRPPLLGEWSIPGGVVEAGESLGEALCREMREETGLEVEVLEVLEVLDRITRDSDGRTRYHFVLIDYLCRVNQDCACASSDAAECRWVAPDELAALGLRPDALRVVEKAIEAARRFDGPGK